MDHLEKRAVRDRINSFRDVHRYDVPSVRGIPLFKTGNIPNSDLKTGTMW